MNPVIMDQAISDLFHRMYRMPEGLTRRQFRRGMRRILIVQLAGTGFLVFFNWFALQMQAFGL